ncbi:MAG: hypothetical protein QF570_22115 [Myxococcota bacterium]|jgi:TolB-like protein|nr:hypothetical protein [Myxococcota bacterium]
MTPLINLQLTGTRDASVIWAERLAAPVDDVHEIRSEIRGRVLTALERLGL